MVILALVSIALMTLDHRQQHLQALRSSLQVVVFPLRYAVDMPFQIGRWVSENLASRQQLLEQNTSLRSQNLLLQARLQKYADLEAENRRLRALLDSSFKVTDRVLIAELYRVDLDPFSHHLLINKGRGAGAYVDQPVLDANGVMGQVIDVGPFTSTVRLITDPSHVLPVQVLRNGVRTLAVGSGNLHRLELPYLANNADIREGDLLVTSGLGGVYPPGYPVAKVSAVERDPEADFARVVAQPQAALDRSSEMLLIWTSPDPASRPAPPQEEKAPVAETDR